MQARFTTILALLAVFTLPAAAHAQSRSLTIERMDVELDVRTDATVAVTERFRVRFDGEWNGLRRVVNTGYRDSDQILQLTDFRATDAAGRSLRTEIDRNRSDVELRIYVPGARNATRDVVLHYTAVNTLRFFNAGEEGGEHDELYWSATGNAWEVPINAASATVRLPGGASDIRTAAYTGPYGSTAADADITVDGNAITYTARSRFGPGEGLTIVAGWAPGLIDRSAPSVARPSRDVPAPGVFQSPRAPAGPLRTFWPLLIPLLAFWVLLRLWRKHGDDPDLPVVVRYEPPSGLSPAETGYVLDESAASREVIATLVDLAVHGHLAIEETETDGFLGLAKQKKYAFVRRTDADAWARLRAHERELIYGLFGVSGYKDRVELDDLEGEFYKTAAEVQSIAADLVKEDGHWEKNPVTVRAIWIGGGLLVCAALVPLGAALYVAEAIGNPAVWGIAVFLTLLFAIGFGWAMPLKTQRGLSALNHARGFREFLSRVESDRYERTMLSPELFDRYLPFAMAMGVEKRWAEKFEGITIPPPDWYHGGYHGAHFTPTTFVDRLGAATAATSSAMAPPSSSSSGSGFGGGGFSGGGSGGGGGGGF